MTIIHHGYHRSIKRGMRAVKALVTEVILNKTRTVLVKSTMIIISWRLVLEKNLIWLSLLFQAHNGESTNNYLRERTSPHNGIGID